MDWERRVQEDDWPHPIPLLVIREDDTAFPMSLKRPLFPNPLIQSNRIDSSWTIFFHVTKSPARSFGGQTEREINRELGASRKK
jgi:hypothetical protein